MHIYTDVWINSHVCAQRKKTRSCNSTAVSSAWISSGQPRKLAGGLLRRSGTSATNSPQKCRLDYTQSNNIGISVIFLYSFTTKLRLICSLLSVGACAFWRETQWKKVKDGEPQSHSISGPEKNVHSEKKRLNKKKKGRVEFFEEDILWPVKCKSQSRSYLLFCLCILCRH